jgi:hypothetical protein
VPAIRDALDVYLATGWAKDFKFNRQGKVISAWRLVSFFTRSLLHLEYRSLTFHLLAACFLGSYGEPLAETDEDDRRWTHVEAASSHSIRVACVYDTHTITTTSRLAPSLARIQSQLIVPANCRESAFSPIQPAVDRA